jgi:hypothetical protein
VRRGQCVSPQGVTFLCLSMPAVMFVGGVVAATVELIGQSRPIHEYGSVSRWIVMYPDTFAQLCVAWWEEGG